MQTTPQLKHEAFFFLSNRVPPTEKPVRRVKSRKIGFFFKSNKWLISYFLPLSQRFLPSRRHVGGVLRPKSWPVEHPADAHPWGSQRPRLCYSGWQHLSCGRLQLEHGIFSHICITMNKSHEKTYNALVVILFRFASMGRDYFPSLKRLNNKFKFLGYIVF